MESLGISKSFKPRNREFLFYHRDKEREASDESSVERQKGEEESMGDELCLALQDMPKKLVEHPIILIDKREKCKNDETSRKAHSGEKYVEHPSLQLQDKAYPQVTHTLASFLNFTQAQNNNNNTNLPLFNNLIPFKSSETSHETSYYSGSNYNVNMNANPCDLLNIMRSKSRKSNLNHDRFNLFHEESMLTSSNSYISSYCEMVSANELMRNSRKYSDKFNVDVVQKRQLFDSSIDLTNNKSFRNMIKQADNHSNRTKSFIIQHRKNYTKHYPESESDYYKAFSLNHNNNNNNGSKESFSSIPNDSNLIKASRLHQQSLKDHTVQCNNEVTSSNDLNFLSPYMDEHLCKKLSRSPAKEFCTNQLKLHQVNLKNHFQEASSPPQNPSLAFAKEISFTIFKLLILLLLLVICIWPSLIFFKFCSFISKLFSTRFPNLEDTHEFFDACNAKLLHFGEVTMTKLMPGNGL